MSPIEIGEFNNLISKIAATAAEAKSSRDLLNQVAAYFAPAIGLQKMEINVLENLPVENSTESSIKGIHIFNNAGNGPTFCLSIGNLFFTVSISGANTLSQSTIAAAAGILKGVLQFGWETYSSNQRLIIQSKRQQFIKSLFKN